MYMIKIKAWSGRLGNNIMQLQNAIHIALFYKINHPFFDVSVIEKYFAHHDNEKSSIVFEDKHNFYYKPIVPLEVFQNNADDVKSILHRAFKIKRDEVNKLDNDTVVIHIRSGDIFDPNPHPDYVPPPLVYYTNIIENNSFKQIIMVSEDSKNPIVNKLLELYPNISYKKNSLDNDIKIILGATNIVSSVGSFIPSLLYFSCNIKKIFTVGMYKKELNNYYLSNLPWKNTEQQQTTILNYKF